MRERWRRGLIWLMFAMTGATVFATTPFPAFSASDGAFGGCTRFTTNGILTPIDFCYILDCQSGFLGGAVQPCNATNPQLSILVDCPGVTITTQGGVGGSANPTGNPGTTGTTGT